MDQLVTVLNEVRAGQDYAGVTDYFEQGVLDSLDLTALVAALESHYNVYMDVDEIVPENFRNLGAIKTLLSRKGVSV